MNEKMTQDTQWYLQQMVTRSEQDFAEGKVLTHQQVKDMLNQRRHENSVVAACV